ncbi:MAG: DoxX family membrane protein [Trueperaceae bacterium]
MTRSTTYYPEPKISQFLYASKWMAPFYLIVRVYVGWAWLSSGWGKVQNPAWVGSDAGTAVRGYLNGAIARSQGDNPTVSLWYAWIIENIFLPAAPLMSYMVALGEVAIGIALILGLLTGAAAFFGGLMNVAFMLAGTLSSNPVLFMLSTWLVLAWRVAGWYGLDRWVLPMLGAPKGDFDDDSVAGRTRTTTA